MRMFSHYINLYSKTSKVLPKIYRNKTKIPEASSNAGLNDKERQVLLIVHKLFEHKFLAKRIHVLR